MVNCPSIEVMIGADVGFVDLVARASQRSEGTKVAAIRQAGADHP
jgi:hypothetical protein